MSAFLEDVELGRFDLSTDAIRRLDSNLEWVALFREGRIEDAYAKLREADPLPEMSSHIQADPTNHVDPTLCRLQYMIAWIMGDRGLTGVHVPKDSSGCRIAVVGGGPTGLAASTRLLEQGHVVDVYEREQKLGGAPALLYDANRLPDPSEEIDALIAPALQAGRLLVSLGVNVLPSTLQENHDAVLLATGCWNETSLMKGDGVWTALQFLKAARSGECIKVPEHVTILCGGDAAMDVAVVVKRLGAKSLDVLFAEARESAHWHLPEAWFDADGVNAHFNVDFSEYKVNAEMVIEAMGLHADKINSEADKLFTAGGMVNGGASVQQCMLDGFDAADAINLFLQERT